MTRVRRSLDGASARPGGLAPPYRGVPVALSRAAGPALALAGWIFLCLPRLTGWTGAFVHKEDGVVFLRDWASGGWASTFDLYTGYLHVVPRLTTALAGSLPPQWFPAAVCALVASWRVFLAVLTFWSARSWGWGTRKSLAAAATFVLLPAGQHEVLGNLTNERWFCDAALVVLTLSRLTGYRAAVAGTAVMLCALSDPLSVALLPVMVLGVWIARSGGWPVPLVGIGAALAHFAMLTSGAREAFVKPWLSEPGQLVGQFVVRGLEVTQFGVTGTMVAHKAAPWTVVAIAGLLPLVVLTRVRGIRPVSLCTAAVYLLAATIVFATPRDLDIGQWYAAGQPSRYSVAPAILLVIAAIGTAGQERSRLQLRLLQLSCVCVLLAAALDFRGDPQNAEGPTWATALSRAQEECRSSALPEVTVRFNPTDHPKKWDAGIACSWLTP